MKSKSFVFTCDCCAKKLYIEEDPKSCATIEYASKVVEEKGWKFDSEIGDLCSVCANQWDDWKDTFISKVRKELKGSIV